VLLVPVVGPALDGAKVGAGDRTVWQRRAVAAGHDLDRADEAVPAIDSAVLDVDHMAGGHQGVRADEPAGADPQRPVPRRDEEGGVGAPGVDVGGRDLDPVVRAVDGFQNGPGDVAGGRPERCLRDVREVQVGRQLLPRQPRGTLGKAEALDLLDARRQAGGRFALAG
jgi:hypothetical protein